MFIQVKPTERVFVWENEKAVRMLGPGKHFLWPTLKSREYKRVDTRHLVAELAVEEVGLVPHGELEVVALGTFERAVVSKSGVPQLWLGPGVHLVWTVAQQARVRDGVRSLSPAVTVDRLVVSGLVSEPLVEDVARLVPAKERVEVQVPAGFVALRLVDGRAESVLPPGRHAAWTVAQRVSFEVVDVRAQLLHVTGQDVLTKDRVSLRLNASAEWKVNDPLRLVSGSKSATDVLHLAVQLALRDVVGTRTLDELLGARDGLVESVLPVLRAKAAAAGVELLSFGVRDVVLPGEMKALLNRVIEAQKEAEANVILRREETAAARSMAQTAKVLAENPLVLKLKEFDAWKELAGKVGTVNVVLGEGAADKLRLTANLG